jgi:hypothetical protein
MKSLNSDGQQFHQHQQTSLIMTTTCQMKIQFLTWDRHKLEAQWTEPVSLTFHSALRKHNTEPSKGASHQISFHFGKVVSEKQIFRDRPI